MTGRIYSAYMNNVAVTGAITLVQLKAGTASPIEILRAWVSQSNVTASSQQRIQINRKSSAATVTSFTPVLFTPGDGAAKATGGTSATGTNASGEGTDTDVLLVEAFNLLTGWLWVPTPEERIVVDPGGILGLKYPSAPAASTTTSAGFIFRELS